ncbi:MAG: methyltransferase [Chlorogloeopsis fritschii C42_A2020_084]|uniref:TylF/MycF/NovP-related O-methyltransferase n=1 Tax=Chlorogloeopsis fritschii TaxID=1124 RepID=UPI0019EC0C7A|nr:TylF/MycF/NovP-related O-methyltransferase [Chlorogloeopsis fritschii]MBF2006353.1 methyltransferase [Chlorogloeopsis fritschii C42_A2020_084]
MKAVKKFLKQQFHRALLKVFRRLGNRNNYYLIRGNIEQANRYTNPILNKPESWFVDFGECWFYSLDTVRYGTLELLSREIYEHEIEGSVAEVGVFQGIFASAINNYFPDRKLYLFDTFEGFDERDVQIDRQMGYGTQSYHDFSNTTIDLVLSRMSHQEKVIVKKGWFPESASGCEDEKFCFVSLDADLYQPIYAGLCWFYPKLANGGYIMVNDYNIDNYPGAKKAVREFAKNNSISYIALPDMGGSVVIGKPLI